MIDKKDIIEEVSENIKELELQTEGQPSRELTEFEQEQQAKGWNPNGSKSAEEWARAEPLYDEIKQRGKQLKRLERTIEEMKSLMAKQEKAAYQRAMSELTAQRDQAISMGDVDLVKRYDQEIAASQQQIPQERPTAAIDFIERNKTWFEGTSYEAMKMTDFAKRRDKELALKRLPPDEHMAILEDHIHKEFPDYFTKTSQSSKPSPVESGSGDSNVVRSNSNKKKFSLNDLSPEQKQAARDFERMGVMKIDKYIEELVKIGELK